MDTSDEIWRPIPGYMGKYEASDYGRIRRLYSDGTHKILTAYMRRSKHRGRYVVRLRQDGKQKEISVLKAVGMSWLKIPAGYVYYHENGIMTDNRIVNIGITTKKRLGQKTGWQATAKPVKKLDRYGNVVSFYATLSAAAADNHYSRASLRDRIKEKVKSAADEEFTFEWDT